MNDIRIYLIISFVLLCGCSTGYRNYIPAPHERAQDAMSSSVAFVPEEQIGIYSTPKIDPNVLQAMMKSRGYKYIGSRKIRSEYALSTADMRKAAHDIGASSVIYFPIHKEQVQEKRTKVEIGKFVGNLIASKSVNNTKRATQKLFNAKEKNELITYTTYDITYWTKSTNRKANLLTQNEINVLNTQHDKLQSDIRMMQQQLAQLKRSSYSTPKWQAAPTFDQSKIEASIENINEITNEIKRKQNESNEVLASLARNEANKKMVEVDERYEIYRQN